MDNLINKLYNSLNELYNIVNTLYDKPNDYTIGICSILLNESFDSLKLIGNCTRCKNFIEKYHYDFFNKSTDELKKVSDNLKKEK
ncbi:7849_t:CDS:1, partial [Entrophospora sp. SA101]